MRRKSEASRKVYSGHRDEMAIPDTDEMVSPRSFLIRRCKHVQPLS